jgi:hypothetical protein
LYDNSTGTKGSAAQGANAVEYEDYLPKHDLVTFEHNETEKIIPVMLMHEKVPQIDGKPLKNNAAGNQVQPGDDMGEDPEASEGDAEEMVDVMFKVTISKPTPEGVKISSKNICIVTIQQ